MIGEVPLTVVRWRTWRIGAAAEETGGEKNVSWQVKGAEGKADRRSGVGADSERIGGRSTHHPGGCPLPLPRRRRTRGGGPETAARAGER